MFKTILFAAAATCSLAASPSFAAPVAAVIAPVAGAAVSNDTPKTTARAHETRYCVVGMITGSIIEHKVCHTRKEWIDLTGTDPAKQN